MQSTDPGNDGLRLAVPGWQGECEPSSLPPVGHEGICFEYLPQSVLLNLVGLVAVPDEVVHEQNVGVLCEYDLIIANGFNLLNVPHASDPFLVSLPLIAS
jgi:hypothetical protein